MIFILANARAPFTVRSIADLCYSSDTAYGGGPQPGQNGRKMA
jgi:hypothetical protein